VSSSGDANRGAVHTAGAGQPFGALESPLRARSVCESTAAQPLSALPDLAAIRRCFPGLVGDDVLLDNAGGAQVPLPVIDAIGGYLRRRYVQTGAGYARSREAGSVVSAAHAWIERLLGGEGAGLAILGASTTQLCHLLARSMGRRLSRGDEIVLAECGHEANIGPWLELERDGIVIRWWRADGDSFGCPLPALDALLSSRTRLVCLPQVSNLLGGVVDVAEVTRRAHAAGAQVVVDGVAFAPHRPCDLSAWGCDWYLFSTYKVYGPHMGVLFGSHHRLAELHPPNHFFIPREAGAYAFELGGACHEGCAGLLGLGAYLTFLAGGAPASALEELPDRAVVRSAFERMAALEMPIQRQLIEGLRSIEGISIIGPDTFGPERVSTVSFVHDRVPAREIAAEAHRRGIGIRHGHAYAYRLVRALGLDPADGVVRISAVHYTASEEIDRALVAVGAAVGAPLRRDVRA